MIFKSTKGEGGVPELISLLDIFVFVPRHNRWYLCQVIMGYDFFKMVQNFQNSTIPLFSGLEQSVFALRVYDMRRVPKYTISVQVFSLNASATCHKKA